MGIVETFNLQMKSKERAEEIKYYYNRLFLDIAHKEKYLRILQNYTTGLSPSAFLATYKELRRYRFYGVSKTRDWNWSDLRDGEVIKTGNMPPEFWAWLTAHPDGYIREYALHSLCPLPMKRKMIFYLLAVNDHVPEIRRLSLKYLLEAAEQAEEEDLIFSLPLIQRLTELKQTENQAVQKYLTQLLLEKPELLLTGQQLEDRFVYRSAFELGFLSKGQVREKSIENGLQKKDKVTLVKTFRAFIEEADDTEKKIVELMQHPQSVIRKLACEWCYNHIEREEAMILRLMDSAAFIRYLARDYINKYFSEFDMHRFYLDQLPTNPLIAILGLSMLQNRQDKALIMPLIQDDRKKIRAAVISWSVCLTEEEQLPLLYQGIMDASRAVRKIAVERLISQFRPSVKEKLVELYHQADMEKYQISVINVMKGDARKTYLIDLFALYPQSLNDAVRGEIMSRIDLWAREWNRKFFVQFSDEEKETLKRLGEDFEELKVERFLG